MAKRRPDRHRRWSRGAMLPVMGVLTVVAVALGMHLGQSAISAIDPLYHRGAPPIPRDVTAEQRTVPQSTYASASGWDAGDVALAHDCGADCPALHAREAGIAPSSLDIGEVAPLPQAHPAAPPPTFAEEPVTKVDPVPDGRTNRYLHYPVSQEAEPAPPSYAAPDASPPPSPGRGDPEGM